MDSRPVTSVGSPAGPGESPVTASLQRLAALPAWLSAVADPDQIAAALRAQVPEFRTGAVILQACVVDRIRLKKDRWLVLFHLTIGESGQGPPRVIGLRGTLTPPGRAEPEHTGSAAALGHDDWRVTLPELRLTVQPQPPDADLPALPRLTDPTEARALLERSIRNGSPAYRDLRIRAVTPQVVRYKPGSRCTIVYQLAYPPELAGDPQWPTTVVAKTYQGSKGENAYAAMRALWNSPLAAGDVVTIAEPLAFVPGLNVLVQRAIPAEQTLKDVIRAALRAPGAAGHEALAAYLRQTAAGLAALHQCGVTSGEARSWEEELAEVQDLNDRLVAVVPELAGAVTPLLARLAAAAAAHPANALRPAHGSFRPAQVLLHQDQIGFIDFDGFVQAEPARDLALFLWNIKSVGLNTGAEDDEEEPVDAEIHLDYLDQLDTLAEIFLTRYQALMPTSAPRLALWEALNLLTLVLEYWIKVKPGRLKNMLFLLERHLRATGIA
jgi:hypothetical protein